MQFLDEPAGFDSQLLVELAAQVAVGRECVGLPSAAVEREHQQRPEAFAERLGLDQGLQFGHQFGVLAEGEVGVQAGLQHRQALLVQPVCLGPDRRGLGDVGVRGTTPQRQRLRQYGVGALGVAGVEGLGAFLGKGLEPVRVEIARAEIQLVAR